MQWLLICLASLLTFLKAPAQDSLSIRSLLSTFSIMVKTPTGDSIPFNHLHKKLLLLDFWSHSCMGCLQQFPHIDSLQRAYPDEVAIILVNQESHDSTDRFFKRFPRIKKPSVYSIAGDTLLQRFFPHDQTPYHVWVDSSGSIVYKTNGYSATIENFKKFLRNEPLVTKHITTSKNYIPSLFSSTVLPELKEFSYLSKCGNDYRLFSLHRKDAESLTFNCASVVELYQSAFNEGIHSFHSPGRTLLQFRAPEKYVRPDLYEGYGNWQVNFSYSYQMLVSNSKREQLYALFQKDLDRYFGLFARVDTQEVKCMALVRISTLDKLSTKLGKISHRFSKSTERTENIEPVRYIHNMPFQYFSNRLKAYAEEAYKCPFIDATGLTQKIDISIDGDVLDTMNLIRLRKELNKYDLDLVEKYYRMPILTLRDH